LIKSLRNLATAEIKGGKTDDAQEHIAEADRLEGQEE
jgi:hypothetical protein